MLRVLNLYAGLGGNRKLWTDCQVTAVEKETDIAAVYRRLYPHDNVVVGDAHQYLLDHYDAYDFIWSSPPCQTHSKMAKATKHKHLRRYVDMSLYQEILFLRHFFNGKWVVENVVPFYTPMIPCQVLGRHAYWANFHIRGGIEPVPRNFIRLCGSSGKEVMMNWLGIHYDENIYYGDNHDQVQILRNCVHPNEGLAVWRSALSVMPRPLLGDE